MCNWFTPEICFQITPPRLWWLWNNSGLCLVRIHCSSVKQKQWKHQQASLNIPWRLSDGCPHYLKSGGDLSAAHGHVTPHSSDSIHAHPGRAASAPGPAGAVWEHYSGSDASSPRGRRMSKPHLSEGFIPPWRTILFFLKARKQNVTTVISSAVALRHYLHFPMMHVKRHLVLAAPNLFVSIVRFKFWLSAEWLSALFVCQTSR